MGKPVCLLSAVNPKEPKPSCDFRTLQVFSRFRHAPPTHFRASLAESSLHWPYDIPYSTGKSRNFIISNTARRMTFDLPLHVETLGPNPDSGVDSLVLLHGYGGSSFSWRYWAPLLAKRAHVVLVDMKGFGLAPKPDDGQYGPEHQAELIYRLILQADLHRVTLIGHSLGGGVALDTALRLLDSEPGRLKRLILVASAAYKQRMPLFVTLAQYRRLATTALRILGTQFVIRHVLKSIVFDSSKVSDNQVTGYAKPLSSPEAHRALIDTALAIMPPDLKKLTGRFEELNVPTLVLWGRQDRVVPLWVGERLADKLPDANLQILDNCGHMPAEELPEESWKVLQTFLEHSS